ncbi:ABC transporter permease [Thermoactinospora rubra]|uniref:ABC transporter permease n=1 Tax=Thermoactinospora rubra TaxID=1088767 RepID=UPI001F0B30F4|nr:ABC transporter permease [Thermoactinospora rubra]
MTNPTAHAARLGLSRAWIEFRHSLRDPQEMGFNAFFTVAVVVVLFFQRDGTVEGTSLPLAAFTLPSVIGMMAGFNGLISTVGTLAVEREDGTLLRCKALPHGMAGYLVGRAVGLSLSGLLSLALIVAAGLILVPSLTGAGLGGWLSVLGFVLLGMAATQPWGAIVGSLARSPQGAAGLTMLTGGVLTAISGIFYPITALAGWMQAVAQVFPLYWLGAGVRSGLLPDSAAAAEIGGSWRPGTAVAVLAAWAVAGFLLAPPILRRMARRESGSAMQARRERAMQRIG